MPGYSSTPLVSASETAGKLGIGSLWIKDESNRFDLPSFKIMGASWAVYRLLEEKFNIGFEDWSSIDDLKELLKSIDPIILVTATDGNHGRAVARIASWFGLRARVFVPAGTVWARIDAIQNEGAEVVVVDGDYDKAVETAAKEKSEDVWLIQDTGWPGYERIPSWIIEGYSTLCMEIEEQLNSFNEPDPDLVLIQVGVGSLAASVVIFFRNRESGNMLRMISVEPDSASCAFESVKAGRMITVPGPYTSIMAGLNCGTVSSVAWPIISSGIDAFITVDNELTCEAMRLLSRDGIVSGESGAAGVAGLIYMVSADNGDLFGQLGLSRDCRVLVISTEGMTDPEMYRRAVDSNTPIQNTF